jgi:ElaB/YqjD/DUF883 family membrane-anchored ribosome-binding protein
MARAPEEIRSDLEQTRQAATDAANVLADRLDAGQRAQQAAEGLARSAQERPLPSLAAATAVGFLLGRITKRRRRKH